MRRLTPSPPQIKQARLEAGLSQADAARLLGLSGHARWSEYETGKRRISPQTWHLFKLLTHQERLPPAP